MKEYDLDDLYNGKGYRVRCMKSLVVQLREDHAYCSQLWERIKKGQIDKSEIEEFVRVLSWLKEGLNVFKDFGKRGIEGVSWGQIEDIEKDVEDKEMQLKLFLLSVSKEMEECHLR